MLFDKNRKKISKTILGLVNFRLRFFIFTGLRKPFVSLTSKVKTRILQNNLNLIKQKKHCQNV